jgi:S-adenosylmethionine-dependent methyltransferase
MSVADTGRPGRSTKPGPPGSDRVHRAVRAEISRAHRRRGGQPVRVLDVGGGSGVWAVPIAASGCQVTVVDTSPNALAALRGRAREAGVADRVNALQGDAHALVDAVPAAGADLVLGHGLLEVVDDVNAAVRQLAEATVPGGAVSVLVAGRYGAALALAHAGRLAQARAVLTDVAGRSGPTDPLQRRLDPAGLRRLLGTTPLSIELVQGDGVFEGWLPDAVPETSAPGGGAGEELVALADLVATTPELLALAARLHALARRPDPADGGEEAPARPAAHPHERHPAW